MRDGDDTAQREHPEADDEEWPLTRAPPPGDQTIDERK